MIASLVFFPLESAAICFRTQQPLNSPKKCTVHWWYFVVNVLSSTFACSVGIIMTLYSFSLKVPPFFKMCTHLRIFTLRHVYFISFFARHTKQTSCSKRCDQSICACRQRSLTSPSWPNEACKHARTHVRRQECEADYLTFHTTITNHFAACKTCISPLRFPSGQERSPHSLVSSAGWNHSASDMNSCPSF